MMTAIKKYILCAAAMLFILLGFMAAAPVTVFAATSSYSDVLDDLKTDSAFDVSEYPEANSPLNKNDYRVEVIQIAESNNKELFIYTYQPCNTIYPIIATDINMSLSDQVGGIVVDDSIVAGSDTSQLYQLSLVSTNGVFSKYKVDNFTVSNDIVRYYTISAIYRDFIEGVDTGSGNDNTVIKKSFAVGKQYAAMTTESGVTYACKVINYVVIKNPFVDFLAYGSYDGFDLIFGNVDYTDIHYIAFTPDRQIDTLKEADVTYTTQSYITNPDGKNTATWYGEKSEPQFITLTGEEHVGIDGRPEYTWKSIYTSEDFMKTCNLTGEAKTQVENSQFVLVFLSTKCSEQELNDFWQGHYMRVSGVKVSDVSILRLMFETDGDIYNLGVVMDIQEGDDIAGNKPEVEGFDLLWWVIYYLVWFVFVILGILLVFGLIICLITLAPSIFAVLSKLLAKIGTGIVKVITLPFRAIAALFKKE